jgi:hypothetical protein
MRPWIKWLAGAGLAGVCMTGWGCGGGDVPDPGSDSAAATDAAPEGGNAPPPAPAPAPAPPEAVAQAKGAAPAASENASQAAQETEEAPAQPAAGGDAATKVAGNSATAEMLAIATGTQNPPGSESAPAQGQAGPGAPGGGPGGPGGMMAPNPMAMGGMMPPNPQMGGFRPPGAGPTVGPGGPGAAGGGGQMDQMAKMQQAMQQSMRQQNQGGGGPPGMGSQADQMAKMQQSMMASGGGSGAMGPGGMGGAGADNGPANTNSAAGAVRAFLKALKAKDRDALAEATAQRAAADSPLETTSTHKELFGRILDGSISEAELDDLATKLEDYKVAGEDAPKSTGRLKVYADKTEKSGTRHRRVFTVRREKKGWGVMDISTPMEFKAMRGFTRRPATRGR